ncbi:hypothetical protein AOA80_01705 [Methanomassiliicoccales archaeon RumEn M1]|nr:hypothetical protein AOA80_01705 [Methanomassiliicoccales archaeon RumEn M1]
MLLMVDLNELIGLGPAESLLELFVRVSVLYIVIMLAVRLSGKRGIGQASAVDFILALAVGDAIGDMAYGTENILKGVLIIAIWVGLHALTAYLGVRWPRFEELVGGRKATVVRDGVIMETALKHELISREELMMLLRTKDIEDVSKVKVAYLETDGTLSVSMK